MYTTEIGLPDKNGAGGKRKKGSGEKGERYAGPTGGFGVGLDLTTPREKTDPAHRNTKGSRTPW